MDYKKVYESLIDAYFEKHPDAGLAWWMLPLKEQPEGFKQEMYDILWELAYGAEEEEE